MKRISPILLIFLLVATMLWYGNKLGNRFVADVTIPVHLVNDYAAQMWVEDPDIEIRCQVEALGTRLLSYRWGVADAVRIPISQLVGAMPESGSPGRKSDKISSVDYCVGRGTLNSALASVISDMRVLQVIDSSLTLNVWPVVSRRMAVHSRMDITTAPQYLQLGRVHFSPDSVVIRGPLPVLDTLDGISTQRIFLRELHSTAGGRIALDVPRVVEASEQQVDYRVEVAPYTQQQVTLPVRVTSLPAALGAIVVPGSVEVSLNVPLGSVENIRPERIHATVRYSASTQSGHGRYIVAIDSLSVGTEVMCVTPAAIELFVVEKQ